MNVEPSSPYVGPRAFKEGELLHGRDREALELQRLIIAERIVLLYSTSGAGKTSLVQAKLLPVLGTEEDFFILPPARVSGRHNIETGENRVNPYVASLIGYWETGRLKAETPVLSDLSDIDIDGYLTQRSWIQEDSRMKFLFLDQFEEILTMNPEDREGKKIFFQQLGNAMKNRDRWVLIAMREEHIAGLDPYLHLLPTRLAARYRLQLLGRNEAAQAVTLPAEGRGVSYHPDALKKLLDELTTVRDAGGNRFQVDHVEPLHLQVVCNNLWARLEDNIRKGMKQIQANHVGEGADVNAALAAYYREVVKQVSQQPIARQSGCSERRIRDWFQFELISPQGLRMPLQRSRLDTGSLPNPVVKALEDHILVRAELRHAATWYEIAHDRLVAAIKMDNQEWYGSQEFEFRTISAAAQEWSELRKQGRDSQAEKELLSGRELAEAQAWARDNSERLNDRDRAFLDTCEKRQRDQRKLRKLNFSLKLFAGLLIVALAVFALYFYLSQQKLEAAKSDLEKNNTELNAAKSELLKKYEELETANQESIGHRLISEAQKVRYRENNHELALLLAVQARKFLENSDISTAEQTLREILELRPFVMSPETIFELSSGEKADLQDLIDDQSFSRTAFSSDGKTIVAAVSPKSKEKFAVGLLYSQNRPSSPSSLIAAENVILESAFSPTGQYLVVVTNKGVELFQPSYGTSSSNQMRRVIEFKTKFPPTGPFCITSQDSYIFIATEEIATKEVIIEEWSLTEEHPQLKRLLGNLDTESREDKRKITSLACAPDGDWIAVGNTDGSISITDLSQPSLTHARLKNDFKSWPDSLQEELSIYKDYLDFGVTQLFHWADTTRKGWLVAVFRNGPVGLIRLSGKPELFYLQQTDASEAELKISMAQGRAVRQIIRKPKILRAAFNPAQSRLVIGGEMALIGMWELGALFENSEAKKPINRNAASNPKYFFAEYHELRGLIGDITGLAFIRFNENEAHNSKSLSVAATDSNGNVRIWLRDGLNHALYQSHSVKVDGENPGVVWSIAMLPDDKNIAVGGARYLSAISLSGGQTLDPEPSVSDCLSASIRSLLLSPDGKLLAAATGKFDRVSTCRQPNFTTNTVWLMDVSKIVAGSPLPDPIVLKTDGADGLWAVALGMSQNALAAACYDGKVWIWKRQKQALSPSNTWEQPVSLWRDGAAPARAVTFHPNKPLLAVGRRPRPVKGSKGCLELWELYEREGKITGELREKNELIKDSDFEVRAITFSSDGTYLVVGREDGHIQIFQCAPSTAKYKEKSKVIAHPGGVTAIAFRPASQPGVRELASSGSDGKVKIWEWRNTDLDEGGSIIQKPEKWVLTGPTSEVVSLSFSPEGDRIAAGDAQGKIHIWEVDHEPLVQLACKSIRRNLSKEEWNRFIGLSENFRPTCSQ